MNARGVRWFHTEWRSASAHGRDLLVYLWDWVVHEVLTHLLGNWFFEQKRLHAFHDRCEMALWRHKPNHHHRLYHDWWHLHVNDGPRLLFDDVLRDAPQGHVPEQYPFRHIRTMANVERKRRHSICLEPGQNPSGEISAIETIAGHYELWTKIRTDFTTVSIGHSFRA